MPPAVFEIIIPGSDWPQTHTLRHHGRHFWWYLLHPSTLTSLQGSSHTVATFLSNFLTSHLIVAACSHYVSSWPPSSFLSRALMSCRVARKFKLHYVFITVIVRYSCDILLFYAINEAAILLFTTSPIFSILCHPAIF